MPMEQMAGNPNFSSDLYALGLVAVEALTGIKPLELPKTATNEFQWSHKTQLSPELERFISKLVRMDFRQRYASAGEALAALNSIAANAGFFSARPPAPAVLTVQPITGNQHFQPLAPPVNNSQFIPPTIIVPAGQNFPPVNAPRAPQSSAPPPKKSSGTAVILTVFGILFFIGFLFVAGKVLNFRWSSLRASDEFERPDSRPTEVRSTNFQPLSLYAEALKQAQEAAEIEKKATTKFEWEQIGNKYKRAAALLASIDSKSPDFTAAQPKIDEFRQKSESAYKKMQSF
jgi:serine/threonine protein kinase